ncbi:hypothetical protein DRT11_23975 [Salmonella enterica subsp. enterica]|nr:hypothetical protein [Salmonella enterica subsp. enterica serovar Bareilly]
MKNYHIVLITLITGVMLGAAIPAKAAYFACNVSFKAGAKQVHYVEKMRVDWNKDSDLLTLQRNHYKEFYATHTANTATTWITFPDEYGQTQTINYTGPGRFTVTTGGDNVPWETCYKIAG